MNADKSDNGICYFYCNGGGVQPSVQVSGELKEALSCCLMATTNLALLFFPIVIAKWRQKH